MLLWCLGGWVLWSDQQMRAGLVWPRWRERGASSTILNHATAVHMFWRKNKREIFAETRRSCDDLAWDNRVYRLQREGRGRGGWGYERVRWGVQDQSQQEVREWKWQTFPAWGWHDRGQLEALTTGERGSKCQRYCLFFYHWQTKWNLGWLRSNEKSRTDQSWSVNRSTV